MAYEDLMQRSLKILENVTGSPSSPRRTDQNSLLSSRIYSLRRSEVQEFARNTSITMSTSELENFIVDTSNITVGSPAVVQHTFANPDIPASDNLYQNFLESVQAHTSGQEIFDMLAEFIEICNNTLAVMRDTCNEKEVQWLELERNNWRLVHCLYKERLLRRIDGEVEEDMAIDIVHAPSEKEIQQNLYKTNSKVNEYQLVADWLEKNAADRIDALQQPKVHHYMDNTVAWENTLHQLQNDTVAYRATREIISDLDPDAPLRQSKPLHDLDMEDEARLLKQVFTEIRCGRLERAQAACIHCGQSWRAASLEGWRLYHDPNYARGKSLTEKDSVEGNPHRDIWKLCAWRLSENVRASKHARAIHARYCGNLNALLLACDTWDDVLWAHTHVLLDQLMEREIRNNSLRDYTPMPQTYWDTKLSMEDTFATLDSNPDPFIRQQASAREHIMQKLLILDQLQQLLNYMLEWVRHEDCSPQMVRFFAHLVLALRQLGQPANQEIGDEIITVYVKNLMKQKEPELVAYYTATLPPDDQVALYAEFLQHIDQSDLRKVALEAAEAVHLPVEAITQCVVENIRNEETVDTRVPLQLSSDVTEEDRRKISALEWVVLYPTQRAEAIWQTNALIRTFLALGKTQSARLAFSQIPPDSIDQVLNQYQVDDDAASMYSDCLPTRISAAIQEYLSHKAYLDAQEGFADWFEHYHHARPEEPPAPGPAASFTEKVAHDHRLNNYRKELERWKAAMDHQTKCVKQQLYNVLLFPRGGWLADTDREDKLRSHQMKSLRTVCIPKIMLLLHTVLHSMGLYKEALQLADLVVEEQLHIYKVYSKQQIGELLSKIRESSLASLAQGKDPWGHPVSS